MGKRKAAYRDSIERQERKHLEDPGINGWIILKSIPQNGFHKMQVISHLAEELEASEELWSMEYKKGVQRSPHFHRM